MKKNLPLIIRLLLSALFMLSAIAKIWTDGSGFLTPVYAISKGFEEGQLIPMGFGEDMVPYLSRFLIGLELFIALAFLQKNYLKKIIIPLSVTLLTVFSLHLSYSIFSGDSDNCGCFGEMIPMSPIEALIKNLITIFILIYLYRKISFNKQNSFSRLSILFLSILLVIFSFLPLQTSGENKIISAFSEYVDADIDINEGKKILCFFEPGCEHCRDVAKSLNKLSKSIENFPIVHIIFSDSEMDQIPGFFKYAGGDFSYQTVPFYNEDTEINSFLEMLGYDYTAPAVIYLDKGNQMRFYDYSEGNKFNEEEFRRLFETR